MRKIDITPYIFSEAVKKFWRIREKQAANQKSRGVSDQGARSAVTGGKQMDGFADTIVALMRKVGVQDECIFRGRMPTDLPGFYRPTKEWDIVVVEGDHLLAAIELKSQIGSLGNNFNNRTEEAIGSAVDIWTAYREGAFGTSPVPWLGYLLLLEDSPASHRPVRVDEPHFPVFPEFHGASYAKRYELFCRKLVRERQYSSACFLLADPAKADSLENYSEPAQDLGAEQFLIQLLRHIAR